MDRFVMTYNETENTFNAVREIDLGPTIIHAHALIDVSDCRVTQLEFECRSLRETIQTLTKRLNELENRAITI